MTSTTPEEQTLLLDSHNLLMRAFTSLPRSITDEHERPIHAVYGMLSTILRLVRDTGATHAAAAFDEPTVPTFRHALYPAYQGQRGPLGGEHAADFERQVAVAREVLPTLGIPALIHPGYEADDILGTGTRALATRQGNALLVSTDRDLLQLVQPGISILTPHNPPHRISGVAGVTAVLGVPPEAVTTYKALAGDASDNIPGVPGIGAKTAIELVNAHGSLELIYAALDTLPARIARKLAPGRDLAFLFRQVVTIHTDLALPVDWSALPPLRLPESASPRSILRAAGYA